VKEARDLDKFKSFRTQAQEEKDKGVLLAKRTDPLKGLVSNRLLPFDVIREVKKVFPTKNGSIPELTPQERQQPLESQRALILEKRKAQQTDNKLWLLQLDIEKRQPAANADPTSTRPLPEGVYTVSLKLARPLPTGTLPEQVRSMIKNEFVLPLATALKDGPYYLKSPLKEAADAWYKAPTGVNSSVVEEIITPGVTLPQLDPNSATPYPDTFQVLAVDVKFEVGYAPPPPAPAAAPSGSGEEGKK
jgi:hypothetical protein